LLLLFLPIFFLLPALWLVVEVTLPYPARERTSGMRGIHPVLVVSLNRYGS